MITRFGSKVVPLAVPEGGWIKVRRIEDNAVREFAIAEIHAETDDERRFLDGETRMLRGLDSLS